MLNWLLSASVGVICHRLSMARSFLWAEGTVMGVSGNCIARSSAFCYLTLLFASVCMMTTVSLVKVF